MSPSILTVHRTLMTTLAAWLLALAAIVGIAYWLHTSPEILVSVDRRLPSRGIENAKAALAEGRFEDVLRHAPEGIAFNSRLRDEFLGQVGVEQWSSAMAHGHALMAMAYIGRDAPGDEDRALATLEAVLSTDRGFSAGRYLYEYGRLLAADGRAAEAEPILIEALQRGDGGWVPEVQALRAQLAADDGREADLIDCLYDLARYTGEPIQPIAIPPPGERSDAKLLYIHAMRELAQGAQAEARANADKYYAVEPEDRTTRLAFARSTLAGTPPVSLPFEIPMRFNYHPPGADEELRTRFSVPGGTVFDFPVLEDWGDVVLDIEVSVSFVPAKPLRLHVLLDDEQLHTFTFGSATRQAYSVEATLREGRHRAAVRVEGETFNLESKPVVQLHGARLQAGNVSGNVSAKRES